MKGQVHQWWLTDQAVSSDASGKCVRVACVKTVTRQIFAPGLTKCRRHGRLAPHVPEAADGHDAANLSVG